MTSRTSAIERRFGIRSSASPQNSPTNRCRKTVDLFAELGFKVRLNAVKCDELKMRHRQFDLLLHHIRERSGSTPHTDVKKLGDSISL